MNHVTSVTQMSIDQILNLISAKVKFLQMMDALFIPVALVLGFISISLMVYHYHKYFRYGVATYGVPMLGSGWHLVITALCLVAWIIWFLQGIEHHGELFRLQHLVSIYLDHGNKMPANYLDYFHDSDLWYVYH